MKQLLTKKWDDAKANVRSGNAKSMTDNAKLGSCADRCSVVRLWVSARDENVCYKLYCDPCCSSSFYVSCFDFVFLVVFVTCGGEGDGYIPQC